MKRTNNIFIVEDDPDDRLFVELVFQEIRKEGLLQFFSSGKELLEHLRLLPDPEYYPALIVTEYNMHPMDGVDFLVILRSHPRLKEQYVVFYASYVRPQMEQHLRSLGAICCIQKPSNMQEYQKLAQGLADIAGQIHQEVTPSFHRFLQDLYA